MQILKRKTITEQGPSTIDLTAIGYNSNDVLTMVCHGDDGDYLINLNGKDLKKLKDFLRKLS